MNFQILIGAALFIIGEVVVIYSSNWLLGLGTVLFFIGYLLMEE